jgi:hypothetical protein
MVRTARSIYCSRNAARFAFVQAGKTVKRILPLSEILFCILQEVPKSAPPIGFESWIEEAPFSLVRCDKLLVEN